MVRATFAGFSTALSSLQANQKRLDIVGQNLSNMNTVGYTRQTLQTSSVNYRTPVSTYMNGSEVIVGFGVHMDKVTQIRDPYLDAQYRSQMYKSGYTNSLQTALDSLAKIFDESSSSSATFQGIQAAFNDLQGALIDMQDPAKINDAIYESELRAKMKALTNLLNDADSKITEAEQQEFMRLTGQNTHENGSVDTINDMLRQIGELNRQIKRNQILGQQSLELMDERNVLLDELSSYIPIEVTYYKDRGHDGVDSTGATDTKEALEEAYYLDKNGTPIAKKEWPDDVRVELVYTDQAGNPKRLTLVEGSEGTGDENYGKLTLTNSNGGPADINKPTDVKLTFTASKIDLVAGNVTTPNTFELAKGNITGNIPGINQLPGGSLQASVDMLWKEGNTQADPALQDVNGYEYYRNELNTLAKAFADVMNAINIDGAANDDRFTNPADLDKQFLLANKTDGSKDGITAANIGLNVDWVNGSVHVSTAGSKANGTNNPTDTILNMMEALKATYPLVNNTNLANILGAAGIDLKDNTFADFMNHVSTVLANDSYHNGQALKTNVTVLNGIQNTRDSVSGVSLDEEASNMMQFMSAYNAASRLMTALDETLDKLINGTGVVGR